MPNSEGIQLNEIELSLGLTHSKGFSKIVRFDYRGTDGDYVLVISPKMPIENSCLTRQKVYFLDDLECQIRIWVPEPIGENIDDDWFEKANNDFHRKADNCLFEYSLLNPDLRLSTRTDQRKAGKQESGLERSWTIQSQGNKRKLLVDGEKVGIILSKYADDFSTFISDIVKENEIAGNDLPQQVEISAPYYFYDELEFFNKIYPVEDKGIFKNGQEVIRNLAYNSENIETIFRLAHDRNSLRWPDQEFITINQEYDPLLLDFYFAGLSSFSPMMEFKNYYNILEFFFDNKYGETEQLTQVINQFFQSPAAIDEFLCGLPENDKEHFSSFNETIGNKIIRPLSFDSKLLLKHVSDRIYQFKNAIFHSKKSYNGKSNRNFVPFSNDEAIIQKENLLLRWIAQQVIKQNPE